MCLNVCDEVVNGLEKCVWPGRCQFINFNNKRYNLQQFFDWKLLI